MRSLFYPVFLLPVFLAAGCVSQYKLPEGDQPCALVKTKVVFNQNKAKTILPLLRTQDAVQLTVTLQEGKKLFKVTAKNLPPTADSKGMLNEIEAFKIHPGRPVLLSVYTGIHWQTRNMEKVQKTERVPRQVTKNVAEYDSYSKRTRYVTRTVTEYETKTKWVDEYVTKHHSRGCTASVNLTPVRDAVYLLDYSNLLVADGCTLQAYRQVPQKDGSFRLETAGEPVEAAKK